MYCDVMSTTDLRIMNVLVCLTSYFEMFVVYHIFQVMQLFLSLEHALTRLSKLRLARSCTKKTHLRTHVLIENT